MGKQSTIYKHTEARSRYEQAYDEVLTLWQVPFESRFVSTSFGKTHVLIAGEESAPPLVLLHGMTFSATMWYPNIESLSKQFRVFAVDTIGDLGKTSILKCPKNREESARWLDEVITGLGLDQIYIGGHSMGGFLTTNYTMHHPEKVKKLVLLAPAASFAKIKPKFFTTVFPAVLFPTDFFINRMWKWFVHQPKKANEKLVHQIYVGYKNCRPLSSIAPTLFKEEELAKLDVPVLLLIGEQEVIYHVTSAFAYATANCKHIETHLIPDAGHGLTIEQADLVNELVIRFLKQDSEMQVAATSLE